MRKYVHAERMRAAYLQYHGARAEASHASGVPLQPR